MIQVVVKADGKYRVEKSFGSSRVEAILASLEQKAKRWAVASTSDYFGEDHHGFVAHLCEFIDNEGRSCSMYVCGITPDGARLQQSVLKYTTLPSMAAGLT